MHGARGRSPDLHAGAFPPRNPPLSSDLMHPCAPGNPSCHAGAFPPRTPPFIRAGAALRPACAHCQSVVQHEHDAPIRASRRFAEPCTPSSEHRTPFQQHRAAQPKCAPSRSSSSKESELRSTDAEPMRPPTCAAFSKRSVKRACAKARRSTGCTRRWSVARRIFANVLEELSLRRREAARPSPRTNYVWSACTHERFSGAVRPEPLRSPPAARDILENRPNRKTRSAREGRLLRLSDPLFRDRVVRAVIYVLMVDGHRTVQTPERASPGECGSAETF